MPRKTASKASATPKAAPTEDAPNRRSGLRTPAKKPAKEAATPASEPKRSRRSSTAAQTAASQNETKKTRSQSTDDDSNPDRSSPTSRATRRPMRKVNYEESDGEEEETATKAVGKEDEYNADEDVENDSDSLESTSKKKGKVKSPTVPSTPKNSRGRPQNARSSKPSRSHKKKVVYEEEDKDVDEEDAPAAPTPSRRGRQASGKSNQDEEEKPKGTSRSRKAVAAASPAAPSTRPSRAARQRKSASTEEKTETTKPVRTSTRNRKKVEQQEEDENEEMEEDEAEDKEEVEEPETKSEKEESKKRKLDLAEDEKDEGDHKAKKAKADEDNEAANKSGQSDDDEDKEAEEPEEKEEPEDEPMEVDSKEKIEKESVPADDKEEDEEVDNEDEPSEEKEDEAHEAEETEAATEDKPEVVVAKEKEQEDEEFEEEEEFEEPIEESEPKVSEKDIEESKSSEELGTSANQNSPVPKQSPTKQIADASGEAAATVAEKLANSIPVVSDSPKATNCESFQSSPVKDSVNGTSPEDVSKTNASKSEPTQMLPSSAIELNQQESVSARPESDTNRVSANGHVTNEKSSVDATTANDYSSRLLYGRPYFPSRSPCVEALSRHRERTFGLVSLNLESTKIDDKFCLELKSFVSDIVCVQGISQELFSEQLEPCLNALGYKGTFHQDENLAVATFYRSSLFQLKSQKKLPLKQMITKDLERSMSPGELSVVTEKIPPCGQVLFTHLGLTQSTRAVVVANVLVPPSDVSIQALQMSCLAREAVSFVESGGTGSGVPLVFCGSFNMEQQEAAYQLLRDGYLSNEMIEALQSKKELKLPGRDEDTSLVNLLWKSFQHSTSGLKSCYSAVTGQELAVGSQGSARTSPDLIWFSSDSLTPIGVLGAPSNPAGHHLLLKANLAFNY